MRRMPATRPANALGLALAEIERLKAITTRVTDGRVIVTIPGGDPGAGEVVPIETAEHVLFGSKHTNSFRVTAAEGVSLTIFIQAGQIWAGGNFFSLAATTLQMADATTNYVFVSAAGAIAANAASFPADSAPLAVVVTAGGDITSVSDRRSYLSTGGAVAGSLHDADQIIDDDGDTSVEVERGVDDDTIRLKAATVDVALITSAGQWQLPITGSGAGILMGGDVQLYRSAANELTIPDNVRVEGQNLYVGVDAADIGTLHLLAGDGGVTGGVLRLYVDENFNAAGDFMSFQVNQDDMLFQTTGGATIFKMTEEGQVAIAQVGVQGGLLIGNDVHLYRAAANLLALAAGDSLNLIQGYIQLEDMPTPAAPDVGEMKFFTRVVGGQVQLIGQGPTGAECIICDLSNVPPPPNTLALNWIE